MKTVNQKRLSLATFKVRKVKEEQQQLIEQLLGQVLGDCHDAHQGYTRDGEFHFDNNSPL